MLMDFLSNYGMFAAKIATVAVFFLIGVFAVFILIMRARGVGSDEHLEIKNLNQKYEQMKLMLNAAILPKKEFKKSVKEVKTQHKKEKKSKEEESRKRLFVLRFDGDIRASEVASLREEITALLTVAHKDDEVFVTLESGGGTVHGYGLGASQLKRICDKDIKLTVAVDKVAASGGYMMACVANEIIAAPFAIIGSIGVLAQIPNFHRFLKKHDIDFEQVSAGKYKRTLTMFGENTDADREKLQEELEETHEMFKDFVQSNRDKVEIENIATGEYWYGQKALELGLVDKLQTSDDYLTQCSEDADIYEISIVRKKPFIERILNPAARLFTDSSI
jgi:serine protease SohB